MSKVEVLIQVRDEAKDVPLPRYMSDHASGMDICAAVPEPLVLRPGERALVPAGFHIALPPGYEAQVRPRSGLAARHGITVNRGDRIAQMVIPPVLRAELRPVDQLPASPRGEGGFGHTGTN